MDLSAGRRPQKARLGRDFFPNVVEADSFLVLADFFQKDRDAERKGVVVTHVQELPRSPPRSSTPPP
jgi:hypothetical protein